MPRPCRIRGDNLSYHIIARCNNKEFLFRSADDFGLYIKCLEDSLKQCPFDLNNFTLMSNHVHLIITTRDGVPIDKILHQVHSTFSRRFNQKNDRKGHFWQERYRSLLIQDDLYGLTCMRYINRNPVRAALVSKPEDWPWSAYRFYALGEPNHLITPFPSFLALASDQMQRQNTYRALVEATLDHEKEEKRLFSKGPTWGSRRFKKLYGRICLPLANQVNPGPKGARHLLVRGL